MITTWIDSLRDTNGITILLFAIWIISLLQGLLRGASSSANRLFSLVSDAVLAIIGIGLAIPLTIWLSPQVVRWLDPLVSALPNRELKLWKQIYYTLITTIKDFSLMRSAVLFMLSYGLIRTLLLTIYSLFFGHFAARMAAPSHRPASLISRLVGACIGGVIGIARCFVVLAVLFIFVSLYPQTSFSHYVEASPVYKQGAKTIFEPLSGSFIKERLPVFTRSVEKEMNEILQRKYEVIDYGIPNNINEAAAAIVKGAHTDREKARLLYNWVGSRIHYDYDKARDYEEKRIWHEQDPEQTFNTRLGVCIDYARLYAVMARSQGLKVKVVTGLGYDGQGGYGPHAWNEVYISEEHKWIPVDTTWASSGNWFDPPRFGETHIPDRSI
ncbi:transglutaminase domain-containing protein [Paenibacillus sediminis]|uniref:Membrane protein required for colicin V production n=1 Tax=Paenibacillus sediminis TaxID=664909 RepID=A0ABS4H5Z6_9BACL|nr:transglutaminase domain-containing protein [Paenibacillus sediminis]MBP1937944.1 putative membrane protein required for colicin V production [Paenibacillus sediminis]